ncbi:MAG: hypothetical protein ACRDRJ_12795 [Streptosporangiaceae bacterium]
MRLDEPGHDYVTSCVNQLGLWRIKELTDRGDHPVPNVHVAALRVDREHVLAADQIVPVPGIVAAATDQHVHLLT